ncbi:MAG TPA: ATP-binding protein [Acetobacteraceae bacterium]|nr:ATP-binding protein [Acetobacteraceae bacterium]
MLLGAAAWYDHHAVVSRARERVQTTAEVLAENAHTIMETAALTLSLQLNAVRGMSWDEIDRSREVHDFLSGMVRRLPQLESAFFVDPEGRNSASSRAYPMPPYDVRQRDYFQAVANGARGLFVSQPFHGMRDGSLGVVVSEARLVDGQPDGLAAVTLSPTYFRTFYQSITGRSEHGTVGLLRGDGAYLFRYPASPDTPERVPPDGATGKLLRAGIASAIYGDHSRIDRDQKLIAIRRVEGQDLVALYGLDWDKILAEWYRHLAIFAAFAVLAAGALLLAGLRAMQMAERDALHLRALLAETERRQAAEAALQQSAKLEALGRLTGGVAHDFNNLLAAVLGSIELASRRTQEPRTRQLLSVAEQAAKRGAKLTAQMLAFARKRTITPEPVAVNALIRGSDELLRRTAGSLADVVFDLDETLGNVLADPVQLELALLNLVANARDAMPGGGELAIRTRRYGYDAPRPAQLPPCTYAAITVADSGIGMDEEVRRRAFEPFFTTKPPGSGTGLGLSMVFGFAQQMGGTATVESAPGQGTRVSLWLPETAPVAALTRPDAAGAQSARGLRALLVDDDPMVRESAVELLRELGHDVTKAADGAEALTLLASETAFDLLLVDFAMPGMNGSELAEAALQRRPGLPVVFITGYAADDALKPWAERGFRIISKPFSLADLAAVLRELGSIRAVRPEKAPREPPQAP